jgi:tetratricopeptide (TPR) repeat protein
MSALDLLIAGRFEDAIRAYRELIVVEPNDIGWIDGLAKSYCELGDYRSALPLLYKVDAYQKKNTPDAPGQQLEIGAAYWCLDDRTRAIELVRELCAGIMDRSIGMAPDLAGGATFGLVLHYMALTMSDAANRDYALEYLRKLNVKYDKRRTLFRYPVQTVKQILGEIAFEDALEGATNERSLAVACRAADNNRSVKLALGVALFHDGSLRRAAGDDVGCMERMHQVFDLGYQTESVRWYLARHEVLGTER